jgi:hydroxymethylpyrimidine pyrophosphatase-like HAD family hydrolase
MKDPYLHQEVVLERLLREYKEHGGLVVAFDFDNTVYDYHKKGETYYRVIDLIRRLSKVKGISLVVWTGTAKERYSFIEDYLRENLIPFNAINQNPHFFHSSSPKIFYSILLDDRAGLESAYRTCLAFLKKVEVK